MTILISDPLKQRVFLDERGTYHNKKENIMYVPNDKVPKCLR